MSLRGGVETPSFSHCLSKRDEPQLWLGHRRGGDRYALTPLGLGKARLQSQAWV